MFDLIQDYQTLFERRMEGLLLGEGITYNFNVCYYIKLYEYNIFKKIFLTISKLIQGYFNFKIKYIFHYAIVLL